MVVVRYGSAEPRPTKKTDSVWLVKGWPSGHNPTQ